MKYHYAIAITGGIAVGKSTVKNLLYLHGYKCIDADALSHKILDDSCSDISSIFGETYISHKDKSTVDRKKLGRLIFNNKQYKKKLEDYMHPKIQTAIENQASIYERDKFTYFIDIPLFFETRSYDIDTSLVVYAPIDLQESRLISRDGISKQEALLKIKSQMDIEQKLKLATYIIDNSKNLKHLQVECDKFMEKIQ